MIHTRYAVVFVWIVLYGIFGFDKVYAQIDTMAYSLDTVSVTAKRHTSYIRGNMNESIRWNMDMLHDLPKILGNADPIHYTQLLPGVQTCSEYNSGLYIQGCDNAHNLVSIEGVPIYNASHLLGFFSIFNASHYSQMQFSKTSQNSSVSNHLGGVLNMVLPDTLVKKVSGEYAIGPMSSQGTIRLPMGGKSSLFLSLRAAYLNLLYHRWLKMDQNQMKYDFSDYNVTYLYEPNVYNQFKADFYMGYDDASFKEGSYHATNTLSWNNLKLSLGWNRRWKEGYQLEQTLYYTSYHNRYRLKYASLDFSLPSYISDIAYKGIFKHRSWQLGADVVYHYVQPQNPDLEGSYHAVSLSQPVQRAWESALYMDYDRRLSTEWSFRTGVRLNYFNGNGISHTSLNPMFTLAYTTSTIGNFALNVRLQHQYLFQTGFSNMGLPTEFWFVAGKEFLPQSGRSISLAYDIPLFNGNYHLYMEGYYKQLSNQVEYKGSVFDFLNTVYSLENSLLKGRGKNYGVNVMLNKKTGKLSGWVSYTWGRALRKFESHSYQGYYPANHERMHELNATATYRLGSRLSVGGTCVYASGTPFTAPKYIYLFGNHIVADYGKHNASRLDSYFRMDLSVNYNLIKKKNEELGFNLSLYNVTSHSNDLYHRFSFNELDKTYVYKPVRFVFQLLPSINIYHKF